MDGRLAVCNLPLRRPHSMADHGFFCDARSSCHPMRGIHSIGTGSRIPQYLHIAGELPRKMGEPKLSLHKKRQEAILLYRTSQPVKSCLTTNRKSR